MRPQFWLLGTVLCLISTDAEAYNDVTHKLITALAIGRASIDQSLSFDQFLKTSAGFLRGLSTTFPGASAPRKDALDWLLQGAVSEDIPLCRTARHFHDPLLPWDIAGLDASNTGIDRTCGSSRFPSSIVWSQSSSQDVGGQRSWFDARDTYFAALIGTTQANRDKAWASTLQSLGQVMHLIADASVPEHVRNDVHVLESALRTVGLRGYGSYEWWVEQNLPLFPFATAPPFDRSILGQPTNNTKAPASIARLIDTDSYTPSASDAGVTLGPRIGIAEFTNANFFSEDTGNRHSSNRSYPFPALDLLAESRIRAPKSTTVRKYYRKGNDGGVPVDPLLAECIFDSAAQVGGLLIPGSYNCVDENVWRATADHTVPRAVDYAAGALEYFFRGRIEIAPPDRFAYGLANYQPGNTEAFTKLRFKVRNATPGEEVGNGQLIAVVQYRKPLSGDLIENPSGTLSSELLFAVSKRIDVDRLGTSFSEFAFDFTDNPIPTNSADLFLTAIYLGRLGIEPQAVMLGGKDLFEPDPLDVGNASDWECFNSGPQHVADLSQFPAFAPPAHRERDLNGDGTADLVGPSVYRQSFVKTYDPAGGVPTPSDTNYDFTTGETAAPQYGRFLLLQDRSSYGAVVRWLSVHDIFGTLDHTEFYAASLLGNRNASELTSTGEVSRVVSPPSGVYRGLQQLHGIFYVNGTTAECATLTYGLTPSLTRIPGNVLQ